MMTTLTSWLRQGRRRLRAFLSEPTTRLVLRFLAAGGTGLLLSAASLAHIPLPLPLGLIIVLSGWYSLAACLGSMAGYLLFWGSAGAQGILWVALGWLIARIPHHTDRDHPALMPVLSALTVAATGLMFQFWRFEDIPLSLYLLRIFLAAGAVWMFPAAQRKEPLALWLLGGTGVLALCQVTPSPWVNPGFLAAGVIGVTGAFPAAAIAGLGLDLAQVTPVPMTGVLCLIYLLRLIPGIKETWLRLSPAPIFALVCSVTGIWDLYPLPALALGGVIGIWLPKQTPLSHRRGQTGIAQVRLEIAAGVLAQTERILLEAPEVPIDEETILLRAVERACSACPARKHCRDRERVAAMDAKLLHRTLLSPGDLGTACRKSGRVLGEIHRAQEQLRAIKASRDRQTEYRNALIQQYQFLSYYLQDLSDTLSQREQSTRCVYQPKVCVYANRPQSDNGDRCLWFPGVGENYFVVLCDGMGTGLGAADESRTATALLQSLLEAGFPAEYALRSLNSLCALRDRAGAVTVDLLQIRLDSGRCSLYKWGASPSYLLGLGGAEKFGIAGPPPGLSVQQTRETVSRLSLRRGEALLLLSDGAAGEEIPRLWEQMKDAGELAAELIAQTDGQDDATAVLVRLEHEGATA